MYLVLENVVILFVFIFLGYFLGKKEVIHTYCTSDLSNFLVKVALPITIFCSMIRPFEQSLLVESIHIFVIMIIFHIVCLFIGFAVVKICNIKTKVNLNIDMAKKLSFYNWDSSPYTLSNSFKIRHFI